MRVEFHPKARTEIRSAARWYEEHRSGLGEEFAKEISTALDGIEEAPLSFPLWPGTRGAARAIRKATVKRFPYLIGFEVHEDYLLVIAVAHAKRRPLYWLTRAGQEPS